MTRASWKGILFIVVAVLAAGLPAAAASTAAQAAHTTGRASAIPVFSGALGGVSATSPTDAWAVGDQCPSCNNSSTFILHWDGTHWSKVASPDPGPKLNFLAAVAAVSPSDAWAVGAYGDSSCTDAATVILHWNGTAWSQVKSPSPGACNNLSGISAISATNIWAVGWSCTFVGNHCHTLIVHWNGTAWSQVKSPNAGAGAFDFLSSVGADSPTDAWAVGHYCTTSPCPVQKALLLHWNGTAWAKVVSPNPGSAGNFPVTVSADSPTDAWAVGYYCTTRICEVSKTLLLHWNGTAWSQVASPNPGPTGNAGLGGVTALSPTGAWATGGFCSPKCGGHVETLILHWNGTSWTRVHSPDLGNINGLAAVAATSASDAWSVGYTCVTSVCGLNTNALILHWNGTAWTRSSG